MRTASQADLDDAVLKVQQEQQNQLSSPPKKPRVSLASLLPQYATLHDDIAKLDADEAAAGDEVSRHEAETDDWEVVCESKNQMDAMQLVADLDEAANRLSSMTPPPPLFDAAQRSTRNSYKDSIQGVIRRVMSSGARLR